MNANYKDVTNVLNVEVVCIVSRSVIKYWIVKIAKTAIHVNNANIVNNVKRSAK